jgi:hypothetical protein
MKEALPWLLLAVIAVVPQEVAEGGAIVLAGVLLFERMKRLII